MSLLAVENLSIAFGPEKRPITVVEGARFDIAKGETVALVGESGTGTSVTAFAIMRLLEAPGRIVSGRIRFAEQDLAALDERAMRRIRGDRIAMVFQEPMASLNPVLTVGANVTEPLILHRRLSRGEARKQAVEPLDRSRIPSAARRLDEYPHRLPGGMRQRVMIAAALACRPDLLIADEPITALDVTIQAQIRRLLADLKREFGMAVLFITHDIGVVAEQAALQMVSRDPFRSLTPRMRVGEIVAEPLRLAGVARGERAARTGALLEQVGLAAEHVTRFPHQFSGGQRQRIGIARALALDPALVICDEPVSALDFSVQAQVVNLLRDLQRASLSCLFVSRACAWRGM